MLQVNLSLLLILMDKMRNFHWHFPLKLSNTILDNPVFLDKIHGSQHRYLRNTGVFQSYIVIFKTYLYTDDY